MSHLLPSSPLIQRIQDHLLAVQTDEANFDDAGTCLDADAAERTLEAEQNAYRALVSEPCLTDADARIKLSYFLNGSLGERSTLVDCLALPEYADDSGTPCLDAFLRSLLIPSADEVRS